MNPYQPGEDNQDLYTVGFQAGAASRDAEIQRLQMALADAEALELGTAEKCGQLRAELAAALAACKMKDEAILQENYSLALSFQPDTSALEAVVKKAGEVMRERCVEYCETRHTELLEPEIREVVEVIRDLPAVTPEDLK